MNPIEFQRQLEESKGIGFVDSLTPILSGFQMGKSGAQDAGRPQKSEDELSDSGEETRTQGSNIDKGGKI